MLRHVLLSTALALTLLPRQAPAQQTTQDESISRATRAAESWLMLLDSASYGESWEQAAKAFQQAVAKSYWETQVAQVRAPFLPFGERTLVKSQYLESLPNAPPGPYVILEYRTQVRDGKTVVERVVPMREADGTWRVSGYFVIPG